MKFNVARINLCTEAEGPYKRLAIWFQGCTLGCPGCCNPELQEMKTAHIMSLQELVDIARESILQNEIEGVTYIGGEPTLQKYLPQLSEEFKKLGLGIIMFTGYKYEKLKPSIIQSADLIIDGQFIASKLDKKRNLVGSTNQTFIHVSNRYVSNMNWFTLKKDYQVDINVLNDLMITGDVIVTK